MVLTTETFIKKAKDGIGKQNHFFTEKDIINEIKKLTT